MFPLTRSGRAITLRLRVFHTPAVFCMQPSHVRISVCAQTRGCAAAAEDVRPIAVAPQTPVVGTPNFLDLRGLMEQLRSELPTLSPGSDIEPAVQGRVMDLLEDVRLNPREWGQFAVYRKGRYTRTIVGYAPGQFIALMLCWGPGQQSPIHDHAGSHCFMKMLKGNLVEERFGWSETGGAEPGPPTQVTEMDATSPKQSVHFMHDTLGLHRVRNPSMEEAAVSLHIYAPPFTQCSVFPPTGAAPKLASMVSAMEPITGSAKRMNYKAPGLCVEELCTKLSGAPDNGDNMAILDVVDAVELSSIDRATCCSAAHFSEFDVVHHLVHLDDRFSVVVSCWGPGQSMRPHTLGSGRKMWLKVASGDLTYEQFGLGDLPWETGVESQSALADGSVSLLTECGIKRHRMFNKSTSEPAVTIQVFSPPLTQFTFHTPEGTVRKDIQRLVAGPVATSFAVPTTRARGLMQVKGRQYLSFQDLDNLVAEELSTAKPSEAAITSLLRKTVFNQEEWRSRAGRTGLQHRNGGAPDAPRRVFLLQCATHTLMLNVWGSGHKCSGAGEHQGSQHWTVVLEGELQEVAYGTRGETLRVSTLKEDCISFMDGSGVVNRSCDEDSMCISLHLYSPPLLGHA